MNIVYIHSHDTGRYIEPYGHAVQTPTLARLAREGVLFGQAFCAGPTCSPSRGALLSGMSPHSNGLIGLTHRGFRMNDYSQHLVQFLNRHGYETVLCGIQHESTPVDKIGYNRILNPTKEGDEKHSQMVADFIRSRESGQPLFLSFGMNCTHREFPEPDPDISPDYVLPPEGIPNTAENRLDMAGYITMARQMDRCVETVLQAIEDSGLTENTLVIYTTDHGVAFPEMKCSLRDGGIGVSLILRYPQGGFTIKRTDALVSHIDLFPTLCELMEVDKPDWLEGVSLLPLLRGHEEKVRDEIYSEVTYHAAYEPKRCIRTERYKLIRNFDDYPGPVLPNIDDGYSKTFLLKHGFGDIRRASEMLFDLYLDPMEQVNLAERPDYAAVHADLSEKLKNWMERTNDPLLLGPVPKPEGARVNRQSGNSPRDKDYE